MGNKVAPVDKMQLTAVGGAFASDDVVPVLERFSLQLDYPPTLSLTFSEIVQKTTIDVESIVLQSVASRATPTDDFYYQLTSASALEDFVESVEPNRPRSLTE